MTDGVSRAGSKLKVTSCTLSRSDGGAGGAAASHSIAAAAEISISGGGASGPPGRRARRRRCARPSTPASCGGRARVLLGEVHLERRLELLAVPLEGAQELLVVRARL